MTQNTKQIKKPSLANFVSAVVLLLLDAICTFWIIPYKTPLAPFNNDGSFARSPRAFPYITMAILAFLCLLQLWHFFAVCAKYKKTDATFSLRKELCDSGKAFFSQEKEVFLAISLFFLYAVGITTIGFVITSYMISIAINLLLGEKKLIALFVGPAVLIAIVYFSFGSLLGVKFPTGILF